MRRLVERQLSRLQASASRTVDLRYARSKNLTPYDVLIIASMVEREAQVPRERRLIASVIYNRLREGIPLGIDATLRFETGNWTRPLRVSAAPGRHAVQHPREPGPAARPDRQPGASPPSGRRPDPRARATSSTWSSPCGERPARLRGHRRRAPAQRGALRPGPREARRQLAHQLLMALAGVLGYPVGHSRSPP